MRWNMQGVRGIRRKYSTKASAEEKRLSLDHHHEQKQVSIAGCQGLIISPQARYHGRGLIQSKQQHHQSTLMGLKVLQTRLEFHGFHMFHDRDRDQDWQHWQ